MKTLFIGLLLAFSSLYSAIGQNLADGQKRWSSESRLTMGDFKIKISGETNDPVYSQFVISHAINGFTF